MNRVASIIAVLVTFCSARVLAMVDIVEQNIAVDLTDDQTTKI